MMVEKCKEFVVIGGENVDLLNSGYLQRFSDGSCEYPSVEHFCQCQILTYLGLISEAQQVLDEKTAALARAKSYHIIQQRFGVTLDPERLKKYVLESRDAFIRHGLYIRLQKDEIFRERLLETGKAVLVFCDPQDFEGGIGMEQDAFLIWVKKNKIKPASLVHWMINPGSCPDVRIGRNKLGFILMSVRDSLIDSQAAGSSNTEVSENLRLFTVGSLTVSEQMLALSGIFGPLSNYYAVPITIQSVRYRSVEHYVYLRFFQSLGLGEKLQEKLRTTSEPGKVCQVAMQILRATKIKSDTYYSKLTKTLGWYRRAICHKLSQHALLRKLLLATGNALLVECNCSDDREWSSGTDEREIQHLLSKHYIGPDNLLRWMLSIDRAPKTLQHLGSNMTGVVLMELRKQLQETENAKETLLPLIIPSDSALADLLSEHLICFTAESVFHPLYPAILDSDSNAYLSVQHFLSAKQAEYFQLSKHFIDSVLECPTGHEAAQLVAGEMQIRYPSLERLYSWEYKEQVELLKKGLRLRFEQHQAVLRALLDTGDALLVFCQRFSTNQSEYSIGMREYDLRCWLQYAEIDTRELAKLCILPVSKRPPFLGGNRLGFLLMELRREFTLSGVFPQNLPELELTAEEILGSDSLKENLDLYEEFDLNLDHENSLWPNPLLFIAKKCENRDLWNRATVRKIRKRLLPCEFEDFLERNEVEGPVPSVVDRDLLDGMMPHTMRHMIMCLVGKIRDIYYSTQLQESQLVQMDAELSRIRDTRRELEKKERLRQLGVDLDDPTGFISEPILIWKKPLQLPAEAADNLGFAQMRTDDIPFQTDYLEFQENNKIPAGFAWTEQPFLTENPSSHRAEMLESVVQMTD